MVDMDFGFVFYEWILVFDFFFEKWMLVVRRMRTIW